MGMMIRNRAKPQNRRFCFVGCVEYAYAGVIRIEACLL